MFSKSLLAVSVLVTAACARITGVGILSNIQKGTAVPVTIIIEDYIQAINEISIVFGLGHWVDPSAIGYYVGSQLLGHWVSNSRDNVTLYITIPNDYPEGATILNVGVTSLSGAARSVTTDLFHVQFAVTGSGGIGPNYVYSAPAINACAPVPSGLSTSTVDQPTIVSYTPTSTSSTATAPTVDAGFGNIQNLIQNIQIAITTVLNDIVRNSGNGKADFGTVVGLLGEIFQIVVPIGSCPEPVNVKAPSKPTQTEVIGLLQSLQEQLIYVSQDELNSNQDLAYTDACQALAFIGSIQPYFS